MDATIIQLNNESYANCRGKVMEVPSKEDTGQVDLRGDYIGIPKVTNGVFQGYDITLRTAAPVGDQIPLVRFVDNRGNVYHALGTVAAFRTAAGGGAALPVSSTVPTPIPTYKICKSTVTNNETISWGLPAGAGPFALHARFNDTYRATTGLANLAAIVTYLNTNLAAAGTWSAVGGRLQLVTTAANGSVVGVAFTV